MTEAAAAAASAGDEALVLRVHPEGADPVELALFEAEPEIANWSGLPAVEAGRPVSLEVSGLPPRAAVSVRLGGEVLAGDQYREGGRLHLELQDPLPFDGTIGVARLEVLVSTGAGAGGLRYATPIRVILEPGSVSAQGTSERARPSVVALRAAVPVFPRRAEMPHGLDPQAHER